MNLGRIAPAPENFLSPTEIGRVTAGRRGFLRKALALGCGAEVASISGNAFADAGDPAILNLPPRTARRWASR